ncbi:MAG: peptidylprolyl isomerase [Candidatus Acidiferrum sp.]
MRKTAVFIMAGMIGLAVQTSAQTPAQGPTAPKASTPPKTGTTARKSTVPARPYERSLLRPALLKEKAPETYHVKFSTTQGDFTLTVTRAWAPIGADRFYNLVKHRFYNNASFFRVIPKFMAQFGINAYPPVSAAWAQANIKDDPVVQSNKRGFITFAKTSEPNSRSTQVFINFVDNSRLDPDGFAPFGQVTDGMNVVDTLYGVYGEGAPQGGGPDQGQIESQGKPYLDKGWPKLDSIKSATLVGVPAAPAAKVAAPAKTAPAAKKP